jgi:hypothetical protein
MYDTAEMTSVGIIYIHPCKICGFHGSDYKEWRNIPEDSSLHVYTQFHEDWSRHLSNIQVITSTI